MNHKEFLEEYKLIMACLWITIQVATAINPMLTQLEISNILTKLVIGQITNLIM